MLTCGKVLTPTGSPNPEYRFSLPQWAPPSGSIPCRLFHPGVLAALVPPATERRRLQRLTPATERRHFSVLPQQLSGDAHSRRTSALPQMPPRRPRSPDAAETAALHRCRRDGRAPQMPPRRSRSPCASCHPSVTPDAHEKGCKRPVHRRSVTLAPLNKYNQYHSLLKNRLTYLGSRARDRKSGVGHNPQKM